MSQTCAFCGAMFTIGHICFRASPLPPDAEPWEHRRKADDSVAALQAEMEQRLPVDTSNSANLHRVNPADVEDRLAASAAMKPLPKCEACGLHGDHVRHVIVRTTNGSVRFCKQCLGDINRKNPETARLRDVLLRIRDDTSLSHAGVVELARQTLAESPK
jgi:hypothetical protein